MKKGFFVSFEGCDGCGKTTLARAVEAYYGKKSLYVKESEKRHLSLDLFENEHERFPMIDLFWNLTKRAYYLEKSIKPAIEDGKIVLCDRFNDSTIAYQGWGEGLDTSSEIGIETLCDAVCDGTHPNLTFFLDVCPVICLERMNSRSMSKGKYDHLAFQERVYEGYRELAICEDHRIVTLSVNLSIEIWVNICIAIIDLMMEKRRLTAGEAYKRIRDMKDSPIPDV